MRPPRHTVAAFTAILLSTIAAGCATEGETAEPVGAAQSPSKRQIERLRGIVTQSGGDMVRGKALFLAACGRCHKLHGEGGDVGPDLTNYERTPQTLDFLLFVIVEPAETVMLDESHQLYEITTADGRVRQGALVERGIGHVTLADTSGVRTLIPDDQIVSSRRLLSTLMPEGILRGLGDRELRDLFTYLMSTP